jgi:hypothetical protein
MRSTGSIAALVVVLFALGCGNAPPGGETSGGGGGGADGGAPVIPGCDANAAPTRFISCVTSFDPGPGAGYGQSRFPEIIYGPPEPASVGGSLDVLSLGRGGSIVFGFGGNAIVDGPGPDLLVFENPFLYEVDGGLVVFAELGEVSVSDDGVTWATFPCKQDAAPFTGCAGWNPVLSSPTNGISPLDPTKAGGDPFDLADVGLASARFVRVRDVSNYGGPPNAGFDLDAAAIVNAMVP